MMTVCLWVDEGKAIEVAEYYCRIFKHSELLSQNQWTCQFVLNGQRMMTLQGGPQFKPNEAVSLVCTCKDQAEIDHYWSALIADGGQEQACGWLKDKYGFSWQIVPEQLAQLLSSKAAMNALMTMKKIDIATLQNA
jgi:predicted 3-demethylubiquinone-9 3-methyltransferase (glyoxalase superfamily)